MIYPGHDHHSARSPSTGLWVTLAKCGGATQLSLPLPSLCPLLDKGRYRSSESARPTASKSPAHTEQRSAFVCLISGHRTPGRAWHLGKRSSFAPLGRRLEDCVKMHPRALSRQKSYAGRKLMALMVIPYFASVAGLVEWDCPLPFSYSRTS